MQLLLLCMSWCCFFVLLDFEVVALAFLMLIKRKQSSLVLRVCVA
jgi:hypothetical protein